MESEIVTVINHAVHAQAIEWAAIMIALFFIWREVARK